MPTIPHVSWFQLAISMLATILGWIFKLIDLPGSDLAIVIGTTLVLVFGALMLRKLTQQANLAVGWPLSLLGLGMALLNLQFLEGPFPWTGSALLHFPGEILGAAGSLWLLFDLNKFLSIPPKRLAGQK